MAEEIIKGNRTEDDCRVLKALKETKNDSQGID
jgi:hypothetical protein